MICPHGSEPLKTTRSGSGVMLHILDPIDRGFNSYLLSFWGLSLSLSLREYCVLLWSCFKASPAMFRKGENWILLPSVLSLRRAER